jgi:O-antigen/teichoic acid export membrane protein
VLGARWLGPSEFGKFQFIFTSAQFLLIPMILGLTTSSTKYISETQNVQQQNDIKNTVFTVVLIASLSVLFLLLLASWLELKLNILIVERALIVGAAALAFVMALHQLSRSFLQGYGKIKEMSFLDAGTALVMVIIFLVLSLTKHNYTTLLIAFLVAYLIYILLTFIILRVKIEFKYSVFKQNISYGTFAIVGSITGFSFVYVDRLFIKYYQGSEALGLYSAFLLGSSMLFLQLIQIFLSVFFPAASSSKNKSQIFSGICRIKKLLFIGSFLASLISIFLIIKLLGESYSFNIFYAFIFSLNVGIMVLYQIMMWLLNSEGVKGVRLTVIGLGIGGLLNILICFLLIPKFSLYGALIATFFSGTFFYFYLNTQLKKMFYGTEA